MQTKYIPPGTRVGVNVCGVIHQGIMSDGYVDGEQTVISRSARAGQALEESWTAFTGGRTGFLLPPLSGMALSEVLHNAKALIGTRWHIWSSNCEHFVGQAFGLKPTSPQLKAGIAILAIGLVLVVDRIRGN